MSNELPPLPLHWLKVTDPDGVEVRVFRASQMRDFARAAVLAEREACAKVCEDRDSGQGSRMDEEDQACADEIRARSTP